jgi:putative NADH-flavin reductase
MRIALLGATGGIGGHLLAWALAEGHDVHALARRPDRLPAQPGRPAAAGTPAEASGAAAGHPAPTSRAAGRLADGQGAGGQVSGNQVVGDVLAGRPAAGAPMAAGLVAGGPVVGGPAASGAGAGRLTVTAGDALDPGAVAEVVAGADAVLTALGPRGPRNTRNAGLLAASAASLVAGMDRAGVRRLVSVSAAGAFIAGDPDTGWLIKAVLPRVFAAPFADTRAMEAVIRASDLDWTLVRPARLVNHPATGHYRVRADYPPPGGRKIARADVAQFMVLALTEGAWRQAAPAVAY